jgi:thioredoxin reductase
MEATLCKGAEVALIGAGNSAGQATVFLAPQVKRLTMIVRGNGLEASMSRYLIDRIRMLSNVDVVRRIRFRQACHASLQSVMSDPVQRKGWRPRSGREQPSWRKYTHFASTTAA